MNKTRLIETDTFDFEFLSQLAERESWRKEVHRPIYHIHKWWAKRLGSVFRGILLGSILASNKKIAEAFYSSHHFSDLSVFDPFMGAGTTIGEAHKLGLVALGRDINPVAVESVRIALGSVNPKDLEEEFRKLADGVGKKLLNLYRSKDTHGNPCDVLYYFWVMQVICPFCSSSIDLFPSWTIARNAYPERKPEVQILCPTCGDIFAGINSEKTAQCPSCKSKFLPDTGVAKGSQAKCRSCNNTFSIIDAIIDANKRPDFRLYGKLVLTQDGEKEYIPTTKADLNEFKRCSETLKREVNEGMIVLPKLRLEDGYNTKQAIKYGFNEWRGFFNDRQLLGLGWLNKAIANISNQEVRDTLLILFSGVLEFNNLFTSYKGEGTGAVRHMFAHHILKPERTPIEANIWGTPKSSGSFSNLYRSRLLRLIEYRLNPTEVNGISNAKGVVCSDSFTGKVESRWPTQENFNNRVVYLSCGDSSASELPDKSIDLIVTDPPFFDNVHYSELADFFYAWQQLVPRGFINGKLSTRSLSEVQDSDPNKFADKLQVVFQECHRVLKDDGLLVFTYHHSRDEGWRSVAQAILKSGFVTVNSHPVKAEMSTATPKSQATEPIQLDIIIVCRKKTSEIPKQDSAAKALEKAYDKLARLESAGFSLSQNDHKIIKYGQLLTSIKSVIDIELLSKRVEPQLLLIKEKKSKYQVGQKRKARKNQLRRGHFAIQ